MSDMTAEPAMSGMYGQLEEPLKTEVDKLVANKTIDEVSRIADYLSQCSSNARNKMAKEVTIDDFNKAKKESDYNESD